MPDSPTPTPAPTSFADDLARLEAIVRALEANDLDLDAALALFEEGIERLRSARSRLAAAEGRLRQLREAADGTLTIDELPR